MPTILGEQHAQVLAQMGSAGGCRQKRAATMPVLDEQRGGRFSFDNGHRGPG